MSHIDSHSPTSSTLPSISRNVGKPCGRICEGPSREITQQLGRGYPWGLMAYPEFFSLHPSWAFADPFRRGKELQLCRYEHNTPSLQAPASPLPDPLRRRNCQSPQAPCYMEETHLSGQQAGTKRIFSLHRRGYFVDVAYPLIVQTKNHFMGPKGIARGPKLQQLSLV